MSSSWMVKLIREFTFVLLSSFVLDHVEYLTAILLSSSAMRGGSPRISYITKVIMLIAAATTITTRHNRIRDAFTSRHY
jgi:hypothetical protein